MRCGILCFLFSVAMSSSIDVVLKLSSFSMNSVQLGFWRFLCGGLFCLPFALHTMREERLRFTRREIRAFLLSGFFCVTLSTGLYQVAIALGRASVVSVLYCCNPLFVAVAARWMLGERITRPAVLSSALYLAGMSAILLGQTEHTSLLSCVFTLLASVFFAVYNVLGQRWIRRYPPLIYVTFSFLFGSLELLVVIGLSHIPLFYEVAQKIGLSILSQIPITDRLGGAMVPVLLYIGVVATGLSYLALQVATRELSAMTASLIFYFKLILSPLLAWLVLQEPIQPSIKIAIAFIFLALLIKPISTAPLWRRLRRLTVAWRESPKAEPPSGSAENSNAFRASDSSKPPPP